jgi:hypothetical protein
MYVPFDATAAARAAIVLGAAEPWRLIELRLVDLPYAARTGEEGERHRPADRQQLGRPDDRHADGPAGHAGVPSAAAAEARRGEAAIGPAIEVGWLPRAVAGRAIDVQLEARAGYVAYGQERKLAKHARDVECGCWRIIGLH